MILTGWKEISNHLRYGVRTVQRWELRNGLPVKRVKESPRSPVVADSDELDAWILRRNKLPPGSPESLVDNFQRALELRRELKQNRKEFQVRLQALQEQLAQIRATRRKRNAVVHAHTKGRSEFQSGTLAAFGSLTTKRGNKVPILSERLLLSPADK